MNGDVFMVLLELASISWKYLHLGYRNSPCSSLKSVRILFIVS
jgi:hypothetical protein